MYLPFAKELGVDIPDFNLSVPGVTQLSMDFHKWGYAAKGASSILYNDAACATTRPGRGRAGQATR